MSYSTKVDCREIKREMNLIFWQKFLFKQTIVQICIVDYYT